MNKNQSISAVILASGEGSRLREVSQRLGCPKHLFPIGSQTILGRLAMQLCLCCDEILCVTQSDHAAAIEAMFARLPLPRAVPVRVVVKSEAGFAGDFKALALAQESHIFLTMGDLIFADGVLNHAVLKARQSWNKSLLVLDSSSLWNRAITRRLDFRIVAAALPRDLVEMVQPIDPESFFSVGRLFLRLLITNRVRLTCIPTLFNVNTPETYQAACRAFDSQL